MAKALVLDAGHSMVTPGKRSPQSMGAVVHEWDINNRVCNKIQAILSNYDVVIYRTDDTTGATDVSLNTRVSKTNSYNPDLFVSIHHNAANGSATGVETFWHTQGSVSDKKIATLIQNKLVAKTGMRNRGVKQASFAVLTCKSTIPACLVEGGFYDTKSDFDYITSDKGQQAYAEAVAESIIEYLGLKKVVSQTYQPQTSATTQHNDKHSLFIRGKEEKQAIYSHADATSNIVGYFKRGELTHLIELSADGHWGKIAEGKWIGVDYLDLFMTPFLYKPSDDQKAYSHPDVTSAHSGDIVGDKWIPILVVKNTWGRTSKGWVGISYGGLIETSFLVKCTKGEVKAYSHADATSKVVEVLKENVAVTVIDLSEDGNWGLCKSGYWIPLDFVTIL